jgi:ribosome-associated protein
MQTDALKTLIINALEDIQAIDVSVLDVHDLTSVTDIMIICSGRSNRHVRSVADKVIEAAKAQSIQPLSVEGKTTNEWVLVDFADIVLHVMLPATREFYQLEKLWSQSTPATKTQTSS